MIFDENPSFISTSSGEIAYRRSGKGPALILVHGWPLSSYTFRKILPVLAERFTCYLPDLPGAGDTRWNEKTEFSFAGQARTLKEFIDRVGLDSYSLLAHDTGATIARQLAIIDPERVRKLVLIGTEIPNHRPPWVPLYQKLSYLPGNAAVFRILLKRPGFLKSKMGFGECFHDRKNIDGEFRERFIRPMVESKRRLEGQMRYLRGIEWRLIDSLKEGHRKISAPTLLIWGEDDPTFPVERAREMIGQLPNCRGLETVPRAKLFVHEERPEAVGRMACEFLTGT
jgi:pimeloyl-ACP methyl ester carboxylesterase